MLAASMTVCRARQQNVPVCWLYFVMLLRVPGHVAQCALSRAEKGLPAAGWSEVGGGVPVGAGGSGLSRWPPPHPAPSACLHSCPCCAGAPFERGCCPMTAGSSGRHMAGLRPSNWARCQDDSVPCACLLHLEHCLHITQKYFASCV